MRLDVFPKQTMIVSLLAGFVYASGLWTVVDAFLTDPAGDAGLAMTPLRWEHGVPVLLSVLFSCMIFPLPASLIYADAWDGAARAKRHLFFLLIVLNVIPFLVSLGLALAAPAESTSGRSNTLLFRPLIGSVLLLSGMCMVKCGGIAKEDDE